MEDAFCRTRALLGEQAVERLKNARVAVFGLGGVGSYTAEALARAGIGHLTLIDSDVVSVSNINRQLVALHSTVGRKKVDVMKERILDINPDAQVDALPIFYSAETAGELSFAAFDGVADAIDTVSSKLLLIEESVRCGAAVVSCMGAGNKLDPTRFEAADIYDTSVCPLARVMRRELKARGISSLRVIYSKEPALIPGLPPDPAAPGRRATPGSISFVPSAAGLMLAGELIRMLVGLD